MRRLDRYVISEVSGPLALGFLVYTFILMMQFLFQSAEMIIRRGVPAAQVGQLLLLSLPNMVVLTIPMALLFGILVSVGRLSAASELTAMRANGVSLFSLYRPILLVAMVLFTLNAALMLWLLPRGNTALMRLNIDILTRSVAKQIEPRVFYEDWEGLVVYVFEIPQHQDRWKGVFVAEDLPSSENQVTIAEWGQVSVEDGERLVLKLENAVIHKVDFNHPEKYHISHHRSLTRVVDDAFASARQATTSHSRTLRELTIPELRQVLGEPRLLPARRNLARVEIHKKFAIPAACLVFSLVALPLGFGSRRGGRASGFVISIAVILGYWVLLNNGEEAARLGKVEPWIAMWAPNLLFLALGAALLTRKNRDKSLWLFSLDIRLKEWAWEWLGRLRRPRPAAARGGMAGVGSPAAGSYQRFVLRLPRRRKLRFPNRLDRYIVRRFVAVIVMVLLSGVAIFTVADFSEKVGNILKNKIDGEVLFDYYKYLSLQTIYEQAPLAVLVTTLIVFGLLSRSNEIVAAKSLGVSLYRLSLPAIFSALLVVAFSAALQVRVLSVSNERVEQLKDTIKGRTAPRSYRRADRNWLFGQGRYIYNYLRYDSGRKQLHRLQVFEFDDQTNLMNRRLFADRADYIGDAWRFEDAWVRSFENSSTRSFRAFDKPVIDRYPETPEYFESEYKEPSAMGYRELEDYISEVRASGQSAPELEVELYNKIAYPALSLVMGLVALPFSFRLGKKGALYGVGIGVVLGMVFLGLFAFSRTLGETGALPPVIAVWSPSIAFALLSLYMFLGVET